MARGERGSSLDLAELQEVCACIRAHVGVKIKHLALSQLLHSLFLLRFTMSPSEVSIKTDMVSEASKNYPEESVALLSAIQVRCAEAMTKTKCIPRTNLRLDSSNTALRVLGSLQ